MSSETPTWDGAWSRALDAIEASLNATDVALVAGGPPPVPSAPAIPSAPLPAELAVRAQSLLARTRALEGRATANLEQLRRKLQDLPARRPSGARPRTGGLIDVGA